MTRAVPASYDTIGSAPVLAVVRHDLRGVLAPWLAAPRLVLPPDAEPLGGGRGAAFRVALPNGLRVVLRQCLRGGLAARFARETYLGLHPRPLRELAVTVEARRRGVPAAEVLGVRIEGWLAYRGAVVTAEVPDAATLLDALRGAPDASARGALAAAAGRAVARLHEAGVFHADLNLNNIVAHPQSGGPGIALLDFDRARLGAAPLAARARRQNLRRLARSLARLDPEGRLAADAERRAFLAAYAGSGLEPTCAC